MKVLLLNCLLFACALGTHAQLRKASQATVREGFLPVTGGRVWYRVTGAEMKRPALIAVHGGPGASHHCFELLEPLADERPLVIYDQLGCGKSDHPDDLSLWTIERAVDELDQVIGALGFPNVVILGHSWGSTVAAEFILRKKPVHVTSLILAGPFLSASRWRADAKANVRDLPVHMQEAILGSETSDNLENQEYKAAMDMYYHRFLFRRETWPDCLEQGLKSLNTKIYRHMWGPSEFTATGTLKDYELTERLHEISIPTLYTCGEFDEAPPQTTRYYSSLTPNSKVRVFGGAAHCHPFEQPEAYITAVRAFLATTDTRRNSE
jgi:proline iminopeptidase